MAIESVELLATSFVILVILLLLFVLMRFYGVNIALQTPTMQRSSERPRIYDSVSVKNPFNVEISNRETLLETDGIITEIKTIKKCMITSFWDVDIARTKEMFNLSDFGNEASPSSFMWLAEILAKLSIGQSCVETLYPTDTEGHIYNCKPDMAESILNTETSVRMAKGRCLLAVVVELDKETRREAILDEDIVSLLTVIDTKSRDVTERCRWSIDYQCIQTANGRIIPLKNLYSSGVPDLEANTEAATANQTQDLCIICHSFPVTRALLPCRHTCICGVCFRRTKLCPICRDSITSYIVTSDESNLPMPIPDEEEIREQTREGLNNMGFIELVKAIWNAS
eukprot:Seg2932.3 transcript_id=Seg2932.3/GoldUCD/mRNA.D3Y31 product="Cell growth regulator with RING finger domain protein 1" protein_id=Seg2932.3/GoldUCD/D3Y31